MRALLISLYELGRQPFGLASPAAWLRREGIEVRSLDLAKDELDPDALRSADLVAFYLPMHTATRLAGPVIKAVRSANTRARICAYGLYAPLNAGFLRSLGVDDILGGEFEADLTAIARQVADRKGEVGTRTEGRASIAPAAIQRLEFVVPDRTGLPPLARYASLQIGDGTQRIVGYTEASRGCRHFCRHCPVVPVYHGQFRIVPPEIVLADVSAQVAAGAEHITFGDPDFFNGPSHALRVVDGLHAAHPAVTYDVTIKIEHLLKHRELVPRLRDTGCLFVTSAVESLDDRVLALLEKGHTRRDFFDAVDLLRGANLALAPTFIAFHPWLTLESYCDLLDSLARLELVDHVAPIQLAIRLLVPDGSRLLEVPEIRALIGSFGAKTLTYGWVHKDPRVDRLHAEIATLVGERLTADRRELFDEIRALAHQRAGRGRPDPLAIRSGIPIPHLSEPWYCCAEPIPV
jgi:radical SAM superfamily enzyme YgiQ (UPF0313 family)